ncbi:tail fiber protein [Pontiellaceae bacterium B1224]|nr:tail fiber protein [Pontiellaceae bacterium B1224]
MAEPFIGEIRMFGGNFAPRNWAFCNGQLLSIASHDALFSLLGTTYGGDGRTTFGLPDLRGRVPLHVGSGPGLTPRPWGQKSGSEQVALSANELPAHTHTLPAYEGFAEQKSPEGHVPAKAGDGEQNFSSMPADTTLHNTGTAGSGQAHSNVQPFICISFIIALYGIYPSRS